VPHEQGVAESGSCAVQPYKILSYKTKTSVLLEFQVFQYKNFSVCVDLPGCKNTNIFRYIPKVSAASIINRPDDGGIKHL
jgi:hypothetical protein